MSPKLREASVSGRRKRSTVTAESLDKMETENYLLNLAIRRSLGTLIRALSVEW